MTCLVLRLAGPLQAWGASSRFTHRTTQAEPTKSGVIGLLAAALGRRRTDPIEDLLGLGFGVRIDQPGRLVRDFQTAHQLDGPKAMPLTYRYYLADAVFLAVVAGERPLVEHLSEALQHPAFPLYLGRRSCPPAGPLMPALREGELIDVLRGEPWQASAWWQRRTRSPVVQLDIAVDSTWVPAGAVRASSSEQTVRDVPVSFDPEWRQYGWRRVHRDQVEISNPLGRATPAGEHDPYALLGGL
mgnify:CR=1 FL=1